MTRSVRRLAVSLLILAALPLAARAFDEPDWLLAAARLPVEAAPDAPAAVLLDSTEIAIASDGTITEHRRVALRLLRNAGTRFAVGSAHFNGAAGRVVDATAWVIRQDKFVTTKKRREWIDVASDAPGAIVDETRQIRMDLSNSVAAGDVFGCETTVVGPMVVAQSIYDFGSVLPTLSEQLSVTVPAGATIAAQTSGLVQEPVVSTDRQTWTWTARDRPFRPDEPSTDPAALLDGRLMLAFTAPAGARSYGMGTFANWAEVGSLASRLAAGRDDPTPAMAATVAKLTAGCPDALAKIRALGAYVQQVRYVAINEGLRYGRGWQPRRASEVFACGYGDCKDKANLLRTLLGVAGIPAHRIEVLVDDAHEVVPEFPSPMQFNHEIVGIEVDASVDLPAVVASELWGRLLIFDATDPDTPVGDLPAYLQGTRVHAADAAGSALVTLPVLPPEEDFRISRRVSLDLSPTGGITLTGTFAHLGQPGARLRRALKRADRPADRNQLVTAEFADALRGATIVELHEVDDPVARTCTLNFTGKVDRLTQRLQGPTVVVKMDVLTRRHLPVFAAPTRTLPLRLDPIDLEDEITLHLPAGYVPDELSSPRQLETPFGRFGIRFETVDGGIVLHRSFVVSRQRVTVEDYGALRQFLSDVARADRTSVLLNRR